MAGCGVENTIEGDTSPDSLADSPADTTFDSPADTPADEGPDTPADGPDADGPLPGGITFEIGFVTDIPGYEYMFVQTGDFMGMVAWISVLDAGASRVELQARCDVCTCTECTGCGICGIADPVVTMVESGSSATWAWDGVTHPVSSCSLSPGGPEYQCQEEEPLAPGAYTARFCWGLGTADAYPDDVIESPACADVAFEYPVPGGRVSHVVNNGG